MADHRQAAMIFLHQIELPRKGGDPTVLASCATANAVLALLDYFNEAEQEADLHLKLERTEAELLRVQNRNRQLEEELEASRAALRAREEADAAENEERKTEPHLHEWIDITVIEDLPGSRYLCNHCHAMKLVGVKGDEIDDASYEKAMRGKMGSNIPGPEDPAETEAWEAGKRSMEMAPKPQSLPPNRCGSCNQHIRIAQLEEDLAGAYAALRAREDADAAKMKERQEANATDETDWKSPYAP